VWRHKAAAVADDCSPAAGQWAGSKVQDAIAEAILPALAGTKVLGPAARAGVGREGLIRQLANLLRRDMDLVNVSAAVWPGRGQRILADVDVVNRLAIKGDEWIHDCPVAAGDKHFLGAVG